MTVLPKNIILHAVSVIVVPAIMLSACAVGPDYATPKTSLPAQWAQEEKKPENHALSKWWLKLGDPTLDTLIDEAVAGNLDVASAKAKIRVARAYYREVGGTLLPSVSGSASATRSKDASGDGGIVGNTYQAGFDASWELDLFGANRRNVEAAGYGIDAAQEELRSTLLTLIGDVTSYYVEARGYQARLDLARKTAASQRETANLTRTKFVAGGGSALDLANAIGLASSTEATVQSLETSYRQTVYSLSVLLGLEPAALLRRLEEPAKIPVPSGDLPMGVPANILSSRPDVRLAERQLAQYTAKIGSAEAARYPSISLTGSISTSATQAGDLAKNSTIGWSFGPSISIPIFEGGQLQAAVEVAEAQRDQYYIAFRSVILTALQDVENASVSLTNGRVRRERLDASARSYREAASLSRTLYLAGSTSFIEVLDAERSLYSAEDSLIQNDVSIATDYIALAKALGGGWDGEIDASKPEIVDGYTGPHFAATK